jgi:acetylornithine/succinyldiaminopimelate/putrescine aminotransferase
MLVEGKQQWLFDETGRRYLDVSHPAALAQKIAHTAAK